MPKLRKVDVRVMVHEQSESKRQRREIAIRKKEKTSV